MKENVLEILVGSVVLILAFVFLIFSLSNTGFQQKGKFINAEFGNVAGLKVGDDVLIAELKLERNLLILLTIKPTLQL